MIDTIVLTLARDLYHITDPDAFHPSAQWAMHKDTWHLRGLVSKQNPITKELANGIYKPRLTLSNRMTGERKNEVLLKVAVSLPKLLYGNNFDELTTKDFADVVNKLSQVLARMGIAIDAITLSKAPVSAVHYSKNIPFTDGSTPYHYINKIKEANIKISLDVNQTDYRNDGHSYRWHCNTYEVIFYDKLKDLRQTGKRALEQDNALQIAIIDSLQERKKFEVLRMEVRLNKRQKIKQLFAKLGIKSDLTFKGVFKAAIAKKVLLHYISELESKRPALLDYRATSDRSLLVELMFSNPELGPSQILHLFGLKKIFESVTLRELRGMFAKFNTRSWYRLIALAREAKLPGANSPFEGIRESLEKFKPVKLKTS